MSRLDWEAARKRQLAGEPNRAERRAARLRPHAHAEKPPSEAQVNLLRELAADRGGRFVMPRTSRQASGRIKDLLAMKKPKR